MADEKLPEEIDSDSLDNALDGFDDFDFDMGDSPKGRKPAKASKEIASAALKSIGKGAAGSVKRELESAMPNAAAAAEEALGTVRDLQELGSKFMQDMQPTITSFRRGASKLLPHAKKYLPPKLHNKIDKLAKKLEVAEKQKTPSQSAQDSDKISQELIGIFGAAQQQQAAYQEENRVMGQMQTTMALTQGSNQLAANKTTAGDMRQLLNFHRGVFTAYMKKDLELKYRQAFLMRDMLAVNKLQVQMLDQKLTAIQHNTSIPDGMKATLMDRQKLAMQESLQEKISNYRKKFVGNVKTQVLDSISGMGEMVADGAGSVADMLDMYEDMKGMDPSELTEKQQKIKKYMEFGGGVSGKLMGMMGGRKLLRAVAPLTEDIDSSFSGFKVRSIMNLEEKRREWEGAPGIKGFLANLMPSMSGRDQIDNDAFTNAGEVGKFDNAARSSLVEIIPGWLGLMHQQLSNIAYGTTDSPLLVYDEVTKDFTSVSDMRKSYFREMFGTLESRGQHLDESVGVVKGAFTGKGGDSGDFDDVSEHVKKIFANMAVFFKKFDPKQLRAWVMGDEQHYTNSYIQEVLSGLSPDDARNAVDVIVDAVFDEDGSLDKYAVSQINRFYINQISDERYKQMLPKLINTFGKKRFFSDFTDEFGVIDKDAIASALLTGDKEIGAESRDRRSDYFKRQSEQRAKAFKEMADIFGADSIESYLSGKGGLGGAFGLALSGLGNKAHELINTGTEEDRVAYLTENWKKLKNKLPKMNLPEGDNQGPGMFDRITSLGRGAADVAMMHTGEEHGQREEIRAKLDEAAQFLRDNQSLNERARNDLQTSIAEGEAFLKKFSVGPEMSNVQISLTNAINRATKAASATDTKKTTTVISEDLIPTSSSETAMAKLRTAAAGGTTRTGQVDIGGVAISIQELKTSMVESNKEIAKQLADTMREMQGANISMDPIVGPLTEHKDRSLIYYDKTQSSLANIEQHVATIAQLFAASKGVKPSAFKGMLKYSGDKLAGGGRVIAEGYTKIFTSLAGAGGAIGSAGFGAIGSLGSAIPALAGMVGSGAQGLGTALGGFYGGAWDFGKSLLGRGSGKVGELYFDVFRKGEIDPKAPLVSARQQRKAAYFEGGEKLAASADINEPIFDKDGNVLVTKEDIEHGLVDVNGKPIGSAAGRAGGGLMSGMLKGGGQLLKKLLGGGIGVGSAGLQFYLNLMSGGIKGIGKGLGWGFDKLTGKKKSDEQLETLIKIHDLLDTRTKQLDKYIQVQLNRFKHTAEDSDDDGIRDGSYADLQRKKKLKLVSGMSAGGAKSNANIRRAAGLSKEQIAANIRRNAGEDDDGMSMGEMAAAGGGLLTTAGAAWKGIKAIKGLPASLIAKSGRISALGAKLAAKGGMTGRLGGLLTRAGGLGTRAGVAMPGAASGAMRLAGKAIPVGMLAAVGYGGYKGLTQSDEEMEDYADEVGGLGHGAWGNTMNTLKTATSLTRQGKIIASAGRLGAGTIGALVDTVKGKHRAGDMEEKLIASRMRNMRNLGANDQQVNYMLAMKTTEEREKYYRGLVSRLRKRREAANSRKTDVWDTSDKHNTVARQKDMTDRKSAIQQAANDGAISEEVAERENKKIEFSERNIVLLGDIIDKLNLLEDVAEHTKKSAEKEPTNNTIVMPQQGPGGGGKDTAPAIDIS